MTQCSKPSCARPGAAVLAFDYAARLAVLEDPPDGEVSPHHYSLCSPCAEGLSPPRGWELIDLRSRPRLFVPHVARTDAPAEVHAGRHGASPEVGRLSLGGA